MTAANTVAAALNICSELWLTTAATIRQMAATETRGSASDTACVSWGKK